MSAVDEIQAAIKKLKKLPSILGLMAVGADPAKLYARVEEDTDEDGDYFTYGLIVSGTDSDEEINEAIVTLHRTIDAQLAILATGLKVAEFHRAIIDKLTGSARIPVDHALLIARAVNGATS